MSMQHWINSHSGFLLKIDLFSIKTKIWGLFDLKSLIIMGLFFPSQDFWDGTSWPGHYVLSQTSWQVFSVLLYFCPFVFALTTDINPSNPVHSPLSYVPHSLLSKVLYNCNWARFKVSGYLFTPEFTIIWNALYTQLQVITSCLLHLYWVWYNLFPCFLFIINSGDDGCQEKAIL